MAININKYVDITSAVGGNAQVAGRDFIARLFSTNDLIPPATVLTFENKAEVGTYFGTTSEEYKRAGFYFDFVSKELNSPDKISFYKWSKVAEPPRVYGNTSPSAYTVLAAVSAGSLKVTIGGVLLSLTGIDFTGDVSPSDVAATLQVAIRTGVGAMFTSATVTYNSTRGSYDLVGGTAVGGSAGVILIEQGVGGTPIGDLIGWLSGSGLIVANGSAATAPEDAVAESAVISNDFGSFCFMPLSSLSSTDPLTLAETIDVATWNLGENVMYMYSVAIGSSDATAWANETTGLGAIGGCALTISDESDEYPEMLPMAILAATRYDQNNAVQNYMFQQYDSALTASVTTDTVSDAMDALRVNYYGQTQESGANISFYQRGVLFGASTDPRDMNTYANEIWLKDAMTAAIMNLLLSVAQVSANAAGRVQILTIMQGVINQALNNGTISVGKTLTTLQKVYIGQITNDPNAWYQVQTSGYWVDVVFTLISGDYVAEYTLVYSKDDIIRKVEGRDILI